MNDQQKKNRRLILIIFGMSVLPFLFAWYLKEHPGLLSGTTNHGELITPPLVTERSDIVGVDRFSSDNIDELKGRWVLVNFVPGAECEQICLDAVYKSKQLLLMMGKELTRMRRVVLLLNRGAEVKIVDWWKEDDRLLKARPSADLVQRLEKATGSGFVDGMLYIMDPLGNIMMQYRPGFSPYDVKSDLKKLLSVSQIG
ncbi:MAG: membrane protein [Methylomicrobium sp.]